MSEAGDEVRGSVDRESLSAWLSSVTAVFLVLGFKPNFVEQYLTLDYEKKRR